MRLKILPKWDGKDLTHVSDVVKGNFIHALIYSIFGKKQLLNPWYQPRALIGIEIKTCFLPCFM